MLTGSLVRVRFVRNRIVPAYAAIDDPANVAMAEQLLEIFHGQELHSRGEIEEDITVAFGDGPLSSKIAVNSRPSRDIRRSNFGKLCFAPRKRLVPPGRSTGMPFSPLPAVN
jgi:hypothetical protein